MKLVNLIPSNSFLLSSTTKLALEDAKIKINDDNTHQIGVSIGTTFGSLHSLSEFEKSIDKVLFFVTIDIEFQNQLLSKIPCLEKGSNV